MERISKINRNTKETQIDLSLGLDGTGKNEIQTGVGFLNHMLQLFSQHGFFDLSLRVVGDLDVDAHHTVEDVGIVLGTAIREALGNKQGITRYGSFLLPMDETLVLCAVDLCGRSYLVFDVELPYGKVGEMDTELVEEFFRAVASNAGMNLHLKLMHGKNTHHIIEALFKAFARALDAATGVDPRIKGVMSTKGSLE